MPELNIDEEKRLLRDIEAEGSAEYEEISRVIFTHPELGDNEVFSSGYLAERAKQAGFSVEYPYCGLPTSFRAEYGDESGPTVAFLAEYDALPGYGPNGDQNGHACGHNWIAASTFAACDALRKLKDRTGFPGKIVWMGTPAEETTSRKIELIRRGAFEDIDAALQMHLGRINRIDCRALAMTILWFEFRGKAAHASDAPENGINALEACNLTFAGINALRQHLRSTTRIHGVIRNGGLAPNVVPDYAKMEVYVRAAQKDYLEETIQKVINCAKGAALMTGATLTATRDGCTTFDIRNHPLLMERMEQNLAELGIVCPRVEEPYSGIGSTDIGNVSYAVPTCYVNLSTSEAGDAMVHQEEFLKVADSLLAHRLLHVAADAMAATALDIYRDPALAGELKKFVKEC